MNYEENKFIIFHQGGSGGDFLCSIINYLYYKKNFKITYSPNNTVETSDDDDDGFKNYCRELIKDNSLVYKGSVKFCLGTHHYSPLLKNFFKSTKMYWMDFTGHDKQIYDRVNILIKHPNKKKHKKFDSDFFNFKRWKLQFIALGMDTINIDCLFSFENLKLMLKEKFLLDADYEIENEYNIWFEKNRHFFNL